VEVDPKLEIKPVENLDKMPKVTCFNCAEWGHYSTDCKEPRLCFICQTTNHVDRDCPEWQRSLEPAQYLGSATQGLGFFHLEVQEEVQRSGFLKFIDNCGVLSIEGEIGFDEIVDNLK
jgi:hypothetical protein